MSAFSNLSAITRAEGGTGSKACIARGFGSASRTYDSASRLQKTMGDTMLDHLPENLKPATILDLGCGTGWFTRKLASQYPKASITGADLAPGMLEQAKTSSSETIRWLNAEDRKSVV